MPPVHNMRVSSQPSSWDTVLRRRAAAFLLGAMLVFASALSGVSADTTSSATAGGDDAARKGDVAPVDRAEIREVQKSNQAEKGGNLVGHGGPVKAIAVDFDTQRVATGSFDYAMMVWDVSEEKPKVLNRFDEHGGAVNAVAFIPGSTHVLAAGDDGTLHIWDTQTGERVHRFQGHTAKINHVAVSQDGRFAVTSSWDRTARVWDLTALRAGPVLQGHGGPVNAAQFSQDGSEVYTAGYDGALRVFTREDGSLVRPVYKHGWGLNVLIRLPGSERLVTGSLNGDVLVVDGKTGTLERKLVTFERPVLSVAVVTKPGLLAVGAGDGNVRLMRLADWAEIESYQNPFGPVWAIAFAPGATALYYGGLDDFVTRWQIRPRASYESVDSPFPRRFQVAGDPKNPAAQGALQFARKCSVCHTLKPDGKNRAGPTLYKIFGRRIASLPGYPYSPELEQLDIVWTEETVSTLFELGPEIFTPGSKMPLQKMADRAQRDALIAFLKVASEPDEKQAAPSSADVGARAHDANGHPADGLDPSTSKDTKP